MRDLARLAPAQWREAGLPDEQASALARLFEGRYPTTAFAAQLERDEEGLGPHRAAVLEVLAADPGFDLAHGNLRSAPGAGRLSDEARQGVLATQRVFKLAPVYRQANALLTRRIGSAAQIKAMGETRFVADAVDSGAFTAEQARATYHKAADVHLASALLAGQLATGAAALAVPGLGDRAALTRELSAVTDDFPNLKSLFAAGRLVCLRGVPHGAQRRCVPRRCPGILAAAPRDRHDRAGSGPQGGPGRAVRPPPRPRRPRSGLREHEHRAALHRPGL